MKLEKAKTTDYSYTGYNNTLHVGEHYKHHSGREYYITGFSNISVDETEKFLHTVEYTNTINGTHWSRPVRDFVQKFEILP